MRIILDLALFCLSMVIALIHVQVRLAKIDLFTVYGAILAGGKHG